MRAPLQNRSRDSLDRMLGGGLAILDREGMAGFTVAAIGVEAGVSTGAIYHRFTNRRQLLIAVQDRFMAELECSWMAGAEALGKCSEIDDLLAGLVLLFEQTYSSHRRAFNAFIVLGNDDREILGRGAQTSGRITTVAMRHLMARTGCNAREANSALRLLFAEAALGAIYPEAEVLAAEEERAARRTHLVAAIGAIVRQ